MRELRGVDARLILRAITIEVKENQRPEDAEQCKAVENPAPAPRLHDRHGDQRCNRDREPAEAMGHALDEATLGFWKPELHGAARRWKGAGFSETKSKADHKQRRRAPRPGRRG